MPSPEGLLTVTLHGKYKEPNLAGTPRQGTVTFAPSPSPILFPDQNVIISGTETATLDSNGEFSIDLIATDTANQNPTGWTYRVTEKIIGETPRSYNIFLPYTVATVEIADIAPTDAAPTYLPVVGPQGPSGVVQFVNGKTGVSITLVPSDIGAIATSAKGAASGVADLDSSAFLVASRYNWSATTPVAIANAGAVGTSTQPARSDHTHAGVALTGAQTVAGVKTFSSSPSVPTPSASGDAASKGYTDGAQSFTGLKSWTMTNATDLIQQSNITGDTQERFTQTADGTMSWGSGTATPDSILSRLSGGVMKMSEFSFRAVRASTASTAFTTMAVGDTSNRIQILVGGTIGWSSGSGSIDTTLYRSAAGVLATDVQLFLNNTTDVNLTSTGHAFQIGASSGINLRMDNNEIECVNNGVANTLDVQSDGGNFRLFNTTQASLVVHGNETLTNDTAASSTISIKVTSDTNNRLDIDSNGKLSWGSGAATADAVVFREAANVLSTTATGLRVYRAATTDFAFSSRVAGDANSRWYVNADGAMNWGPASTTGDTFLSRAGVGVLQMTGNTRLAAILNAGGTATLAYSTFISGETNDRFQVRGDGMITWGSGSGAGDVNLYRANSTTLKTDFGLSVAGNVSVGGNLTVTGIGSQLYAVKSSNTTVTSNTTLQNDPHLLFNSLPINTSWIVDGYFIYGADPAADVRLGFTGPTGATFDWNVTGIDSTQTSTSAPMIADNQAIGTSAFGLAGITNNTKQMMGKLHGLLKMGGTSGTFQFAWAQNTTSATGSIFYANSWIRLTRVA